MVNAYIEIKCNANGQYFFTYKSTESFLAVSSSFASRSLLERHLSQLRKYGPSVEVFYKEKRKAYPCIIVEEIENSMYRFQFLLSLNQALIQSDLAFSLEACFQRIQHFKNTIEDARLVDLTEY